MAFRRRIVAVSSYHRPSCINLVCSQGQLEVRRAWSGHACPKPSRQANVISIHPRRQRHLPLISKRPSSTDFRLSGGWLFEEDHNFDITETSPASIPKMPIVHIVLFEFKPTTTYAQVEDVCKRMIGLSEKCVHPQTNQPYVKGHGGGRDNSPEGHQGGFSHGFVSEFQNEEDRRYYLEKDPAHLAFVKSLDGIIENVRVVDFEPGKF